jgi:hypothetical protein
VITCTKTGEPAGIVNVKPDTSGVAVDSSHAGYSYRRTPITVIMGKTTLVY